MSEWLINGILLLLILVTSVTVLMMRNLFSATMVMSLYSLLMALVWLNLDAVDVSFTEAAVGAGISSILLIGALVVVGSEEKTSRSIHWPALLIVVVTTATLVYGTLDIAGLGDPLAPVHRNVAPEYIAQSVGKNAGSPETAKGGVGNSAVDEDKDGHGDYFHGHVPNLVTSVIVAYRAYDTMFEVAVIFTAGISLVLLLRGRKS